MIQKEKHFLDTSPFISIIKMDENSRLSNRYFARLRSGVYKGYVSFSVYAEGIYIIKRDIERDEWTSTLYKFLSLIEDNNIETLIPKTKDIARNLQSIEDIKKRIGPTDTRLLADAISLGIPYFATLDTKLGKRIEDEHSRELIKVKVIDKNLFVK